MLANRRCPEDKEKEKNIEKINEYDALLDGDTGNEKYSRAAMVNQFWPNRCTCLILLSVLCLWFGYFIVDLARDVFPETDLILNSQCKSPMQNWDGRIPVIKLQVRKSGYQDRPSYYNLHHERDYVGNDSNHQIFLKNNAGSQRPVIIFGTHHKTGTFLAKKLFSRICSKMNWCCLFHVTRDSIHAVAAALQNEPVNAVGHNQWIWNPNILGLKNFRFVHFYRHPFKKIVSGYRYHADGTEEWTQKPLRFGHLCNSPLSRHDHTQHVHSSHHFHHGPRAEASIVWDFCEGVHLCETCCRMEHERLRAPEGNNGKAEIEVFQRSHEEYQFLCDYLGKGNDIMANRSGEHISHGKHHVQFSSTPSIQDMLLAQPPEHGILTEAALDYYENLRMANIINETAGDPRVLNIDLDDLNNHFSEVTMRLLQFLKGIIPSKRINELHADLAFYDLQTSPIYRWSMSNPIINHVTGDSGKSSQPSTSTIGNLKGTANNSDSPVHRGYADGLEMSGSQLMKILQNNERVMSLYEPVLELMHGVLSVKATAHN